MSMTGEERRKGIVRQIREGEKPIPAKMLAADYGVSRQVIVQDIALIRAAGYEIISTNRGYILAEPKTVSRVFKVQHTDEQLEEELCAIVYGHMEANIMIRSRRNVAEFLEDIRSGKSSPLKNITSNYHYHTVSADSEHTLDLIEEDLKKRGFLVV